jgi:hypothetical protein
MKQEVNSFQVRHFKSINPVAGVVRTTQKLLYFVNCQDGTQPVPFIVLRDKETDVGIRCLIARPAKGHISKRSGLCWSKAVESRRVASIVRRLLFSIRLRYLGSRDVNGYFISEQAADAVFDHTLRYQGHKILEVRLRCGLACIIGTCDALIQLAGVPRFGSYSGMTQLTGTLCRTVSRIRLLKACGLAKSKMSASLHCAKIRKSTVPYS